MIKNVHTVKLDNTMISNLVLKMRIELKYEFYYTIRSRDSKEKPKKLFI